MKKYYQAHKESYEEKGWGEKQQEEFIEGLVEWSEEKINPAWTLASRLGAIFGAVYILDKEKVSVMNSDLPYKKRTTLEFDEGNKKTIQANKDIDFRQLAQRRNQAEQELALIKKCKLKIKTMELSYEEELKIWLEIVNHLDKAAEYVEISTLGDLSDAVGAREKALEILKALGLEEEFKRESLALAEVYIKTAQVYERIHQVGAPHISLENIALSYHAATDCFTKAGPEQYRNAAQYGMKAAGFYEQAGGIENLSLAKELYEWAAQGFEYLGENEKAKEALKKAESIKLKIQAKRI